MIDDAYPEFLGKYRIEGILGRGAMGVVYRGFDPAIEREVAIKTVRSDLLVGEDGEDWLERFQREARAAGRLLHPNIVAVFEYGEHEGTPYIAMEYVEGQELHDYVRFQGPPPLDETVSIVVQILYGLEAAHNRAVVHRDIKPANIILLSDGTVKVADFGIARVDSVSRTMPGAVAGTPTYMSPEQVTGGNVDSRSDLFSTGVILYELLSGERPFPGKTATEVMYKVVNTEPVPIDRLLPDLPHAVVDVVERALAKDAADRFQTAGQFADALFAAAQEPAPYHDAPPFAEDEAEDPYGSVASEGDSTHGDQIRLLEEALAVHVGPVAKVMVRMATQQAQSIEALCDQLGKRISDIHESRRFVTEARAIFGLPALATPAASASPASPAASRAATPRGGVDASTGVAHRSSDLNARAGDAMRRAPDGPPAGARARRFFSGVVTLAVLGGAFFAYLYFVEPELLSGLTTTVSRQAGDINLGSLGVGSADPSHPGNSPFEARLNRDDRRDIQRALTNLRFYSGPIDGDFGRQTRDAIRGYQRQVGIVQTGVLDADVATELLDRAGLLRVRR